MEHPHGVGLGFELVLGFGVKFREEIELGFLLDFLDGDEELVGLFVALDVLRDDDGEGAGLALLFINDDFVEGGGDVDAGREGFGGAAIEIGEDGAIDDPDFLEGIGVIDFFDFEQFPNFLVEVGSLGADVGEEEGFLLGVGTVAGGDGGVGGHVSAVIIRGGIVLMGDLGMGAGVGEEIAFGAWGDEGLGDLEDAVGNPEGVFAGFGIARDVAGVAEGGVVAVGAKGFGEAAEDEAVGGDGGVGGGGVFRGRGDGAGEEPDAEDEAEEEQDDDEEGEEVRGGGGGFIFVHGGIPGDGGGGELTGGGERGDLVGAAEVPFADVGVVGAFASDGGGGAVAGEDFGVIGEEHDAGEGFAEEGDVAIGEIVASDGTGHEEIAGEEDVVFGGVEADVAFGVSGGVEDGEGDGADVDFVAIGEVGVSVAWGDGVGEFKEE